MKQNSHSNPKDASANHQLAMRRQKVIDAESALAAHGIVTRVVAVAVARSHSPPAQASSGGGGARAPGRLVGAVRPPVIGSSATTQNAAMPPRDPRGATRVGMPGGKIS